MTSIEEYTAGGELLARFAAPVDASQEPTHVESQSFTAPTDITWDAAGNIFVADAGRDRIVKYTSDGQYVTAVGSPGSASGQLRNPHSVASDAAGNIYVADHGNARVQVFDNNLNPRATFDGIGRPWALCVTPGPHQYLFSSSNTESPLVEMSARTVAEIYQMELDGTIVGKLRPADDPRVRLLIPHAIDCSVNGEIVAAGAFPSMIVYGR